ncbi:MAG: YraN family protein [Deltaproteobacteria bacterium]|nr:MAG: YraN family protein [Deltaproteobacteria bacterium]
MTKGRKDFGKAGEELAAKYLRKRKYKIIKRNYSCPYGEIDIIALDGKSLVFIEVKTRSSTTFGPPQSAVDRKKQIQISKVATDFIKRKKITRMDMRFDVVSVQLLPGDEFRVELIRNAFDLCLG